MEKRLPSSYRNLIDITLGTQVQKQPNTFTGVTISDMKNANQKRVLFQSLSGWTADVGFLKREMKEE